MTISNKYKYFFLYIIVIYILNKNLWDFLLGALGKIVYYFIIAIFGIAGLMSFFRKKETRKIAIAFILYVVVIVLNGFVISNSDQRAVGLMEYLVYPLPFFAITYLMNMKQNYNGILIMFVRWGVFTSLLAIVEFIRKVPLISNVASTTYHYYNGRVVVSAYRPVVFIGSPMILAILLGIALVLAVYLYEFEKKRKYRYSIFLILIGILTTGSRAPLLSAVIGIIIMFFYKEQLGRGNKKFILGITLSAVCLFAFFILSQVFPNFKTGISLIDTIVLRFSTTFNFQHEWGNVERLARWSYYIGQFFKKPIVGYGIASTSAAVTSNQLVTLHGITTESGVLARLVETGIIGTSLYYYVFFLSISLSFKRLKKRVRNGDNEYFFAFIGCVWLFIIEDMVLQVSLDIFATFAIWFIVAFAFNVIRSDDYRL